MCVVCWRSAGCVLCVGGLLGVCSVLEVCWVCVVCWRSAGCVLCVGGLLGVCSVLEVC